MHKKIFILIKAVTVISFVFLLTGCARQHVVKVYEDKLVFSYLNPGANKVFFVYSVNGFKYQPTSRERKGNWLVTVPLHKDFTYFYIVDGVTVLPKCSVTVLDDFGSRNCLYRHGR